MRVLKDAGFTTLQFTATAASAEFPLGVFLPLLSESNLHSEPPASLEQLYQCLAALTNLRGERRLAIFLDNAERLDQSSAFVLQMLSESSGCLLVATVHENFIRKAPAPLTELWKNDEIEFVNVPRLAEKDISGALVEALDGLVHPAATSKLNRLSQGNLFFLRELVAESVRTGHLRLDLGTWHLADSPALSSRLKDMVEEQLAGLHHEERSVLEYVSAGEPIPQAALESLCATQHIESLESGGFINSAIEHGRLRYRVGHPLHAELVRQSTPALRSREISLALARTMAADAGSPPAESLLRSSAWTVDSGDPELIFSVAKAARARRDFDRAHELGNAVANIARNFEINCFLAVVASLRGDRTTAMVEIINALNSAETEDQLCELAGAVLNNCLYIPETLNQAVSLGARLGKAVADPARGDLLVKLRLAKAATRSVDSMVEVAAEALPTASDPLLAWMAIPSAYALAHRGKFGRSYEIARKGRTAYRTAVTGLDQPAAMYEYVLGEISALSGRIEQTYNAASEQYELSVSDESHEGQAWFLLQMSKLVGERGYPRTTVTHARSALLLSEKLGRHYPTVHSRGYLAMALSLCGRTVEATQVISSLDTSMCPRWESELLHVEAWVMAMSGNVRTALELLDDGLRRCAESGDILNESAIVHSIARLGEPRSACQRLGDLAAEDEGTLVTARAEHVQALVRFDPRALEAAASAFERCGAWLLAIEALADSVSAYQKQGQSSQAIAVAHRALAVKQRCEDPETPALKVLGQVPRLTKSEMQVASLAAHSNTNKQIADRLCVSPRTVENHLRQVYRKLAIRGREELYGLLGDRSHIGTA
jgi:DNA-binding CsgD family transcriptional regulator